MTKVLKETYYCHGCGNTYKLETEVFGKAIFQENIICVECGRGMMTKEYKLIDTETDKIIWEW